MIRIQPNYLITMNRGDTGVLEFNINLGTAVCQDIYDMKEGDFIYFGLLEPNQKWERAILKKTYSYEDYDQTLRSVKVRFEPEDTEYLLPGTYYYQIKLFRPHETTDDGYDHIDTIIDRTKITILA